MKVFCVLLVLGLIGMTVAADKPVTACRMQRDMAKAGDFKPRCSKNGDYAPLQTRDGWFWCANKAGEMLMKSQQTKPDCSKYPR